MSGNTRDKGLPANVDAERFVLGSIMLDDSLYIHAAGALESDDFILEKHRRIFQRMGELYERGERVDRITVANELMRHGELEACDGLGYLVSLDDGLPQIRNPDAYIRIVKDKAILRRIVYASDYLMKRCLAGEEEPEEILASAEETLLKLGEQRVKSGLVDAQSIISSYEGGLTAFLDPSKRIKGISTGFRKLDEFTGGMHAGDLFILAARPSMGKTAMALNIARARGAEAEADGGHLLAGNVEGIAADAPAVRHGPRGQSENSAWATSTTTSGASSTRRCTNWWRRRSISTTRLASTSWICTPSCAV